METTFAQQLAAVRAELKKVSDKASSLPMVMRAKEGYDDQIAALKAQEKELIAKAKREEIHGAKDKALEDLYQTEEEERAKTMKTLKTVGIISGGLLLVVATIVVIKKMRKK